MAIDKEVLEAAKILCVDEETIEEMYCGKHAGDIFFAHHIAMSDGGEIAENILSNGWPCSAIDWEQAASDLTLDYLEHEGHYFRK